jgi:tetratricopeptide (TPR) repeat protein
MKRLSIALSFIVAVCLMSLSNLQAQLDVPQKSPKANISFRVGITDVTINYCSPAVRGRGIWGKLVPYDKVWRAGANEATTVEFSTEIVMSGVVLPKGKYGLFLIPSKNGSWTAIFNKVWDQWGAYNYDEIKDALRIPIEAKSLTEVVEHLRYRITEKDIENGIIIMEWERKQVIIPFATDAINQSMNNIEKALKTAKDQDKWWLHMEAAELQLDHYCNVDLALAHANTSIKLKPTVRGYWGKARALAWKQDYAGAIAATEKAKTLSATNNEEKEYYASVKEQLEASLKEWKKL